MDLSPIYDICPICGETFICRKMEIIKDGFKEFIYIKLQQCRNNKCRFEFLEEPEDMSIEQAKTLLDEYTKEYIVEYKEQNLKEL